MALISLARQPKRGPIGALPRIIQDHPLAQGLVGCWVPGVSDMDLTTGYAAITGPYPGVTGRGSPVFTRGGSRARRFSGTDSMALGNSARYNQGLKGISVGVLYTPVAASTTGQLLSRDSAGARSFITSHNEGGLEQWVVFNSVGGYVTLATPTVTTATERFLLCSANNEVGGWAIARDGVTVATSGTLPFTPPTGNTATTTLGFREYAGAGNGFQGDIAIAFLWDRSVWHIGGGDGTTGGQAHKDLARDPWALLTWRQAPSVFILSGGVSGAPSFTGSGAVTLNPVVGAGTGTNVKPVRTGSGAVTLAALVGAGSGTVTAGTRTGSGAVTLNPLVGAGVGTGGLPASGEQVSHDVRTGQPDPRWRDRGRATWPAPLKTRGNHYGRY